MGENFKKLKNIAFIKAGILKTYGDFITKKIALESVLIWIYFYSFK